MADCNVSQLVHDQVSPNWTWLRICRIKSSYTFGTEVSDDGAIIESSNFAPDLVGLSVFVLTKEEKYPLLHVPGRSLEAPSGERERNSNQLLDMYVVNNLTYGAWTKNGCYTLFFRVRLLPNRRIMPGYAALTPCVHMYKCTNVPTGSVSLI